MVFEEFEKEVKKVVEEALDREIDEKYLEEPPKEEFGDLACTITFKLAKEKGKNPKRIAQELKEKIELKGLIKKVETRGPYLNFFFEGREFGKLTVSEVLENKDYGSSDFGKGKKVMVEYSAPNPSHPLHVGHTRGTFVGDALSRIMDYAGYDVVKANYMNDMGRQVARLVTAYQLWGENKEPKGKPDHWLWDYYVKIHEEIEGSPEVKEKVKQNMIKYEIEGDPELVELWNKIVGWCVEGFKQTYEELGVNFDVYLYEHSFRERGKKIVKRALEKGIAREGGEGAIIADLEKYGLPNPVILRSNGTGLYITSDLGMTPAKFENYDLDESIWVVGEEQKTNFKQLFKILELLGYSWIEKCYHLPIAMLQLEKGKMSSREGKAVVLDTLIKKVTSLALEEVEKRHPELSKDRKKEIAKKIGIGALKYWSLKVETNKQVVFKEDKALSFQGETGPYCQYACVRANKILKKADIESSFNLKELKGSERALVREVSKFSSVIKNAAENKQPHILANYVYKLALIFNNFYEKCSVLNAESTQLKRSRLALVKSLSLVLEKGLDLLGIEVPEQM